MVYDTVYAHQVFSASASAAAITAAAPNAMQRNQDAADDAKLSLNSTAVAWGDRSKT